MPCYHPIDAWLVTRVRNGVKSRKVYFKPPESEDVGPMAPELIQVPCGKCIGCKLERSRQWAVRCVHEAQMHDFNCFLTLTYDNDHLPVDGSLQPRHMTLFLKRLRKAIYPEKIRFLQCGEYGAKLGRPHHHVLLFGYDFPDKVLQRVSRGNPLYTSKLLSDLWPYGFHSIGALTFESAAYVARYVLKKATKKDEEQHYAGKHPEYITMSRRPGIAAGWLQQYESDVYPRDYVVIRDGIQCKPPRYYDKLFASAHGEIELEKLKKERKKAISRRQEHTTPERLEAREALTQLNTKRLVREYETL